MLPEELTVTYDPTGGEIPAAFVYDKKTHEENRAFYREHDALAEGSPYADNILMRIEDPKRTASSYGTSRHFITIRAEETVDTPNGGTMIVPQLMKIETSSPVGFTTAGRRKVFERLIALLQHAEFENFYFSNEC